MSNLIKSGIGQPEDLLTKLECAHIIRQKLLECVLTNAFYGYQYWNSGFSSNWAEIPSSRAVHILENGIRDLEGPKNIHVMLSCVQHKCVVCQREKAAESNLIHSSDEGDDGELFITYSITQLK